MNKRRPSDPAEERKRISRRQFIKHSVVAIAGVAAAQTGLAMPTTKAYAATNLVKRTGVTATMLRGATPAYVARPEISEMSPAVLLLHNWEGITLEVQSATQRLAQGGLLSCAPDLRRSDGISVDRLHTAIDAMLLEQNGYIQTGMLGLLAFGSSAALAFALAQSYNRIGATVILYDGVSSQDSMLPSKFYSTHPAGHGPLILRMFESDTPLAARAAATEDAWGRALRWLKTNLTV